MSIFRHDRAIAVRWTASLPLACARSSTSFLQNRCQLRRGCSQQIGGIKGMRGTINLNGLCLNACQKASASLQDSVDLGRLAAIATVSMAYDR